MTTFNAELRLSLVDGHAADIFHVGIAYPLQQTYRLPAPRPAVAVDEQGRILPCGDGLPSAQLLQGPVDAVEDVALPVLLGRAHVQ